MTAAFSAHSNMHESGNILVLRWTPIMVHAAVQASRAQENVM